MMKKSDPVVLWSDKPHNFLGLKLNFTRYFLTNDKLIVRKGFLNIKEEEIMLYRILDKKINRPLSQRIFKCSSVTIFAKDVTSGETIIKAVKDVDGLVNKLDSLISAARKEYGITAREIYGVGGEDMM